MWKPYNFLSKEKPSLWSAKERILNNIDDITKARREFRFFRESRFMGLAIGLSIKGLVAVKL